MKIFVQRAGFLTTVQDLGRTGWRRFGVSVGGALDQHAFRVINLLVGNEESAAGLEVTQGTTRLRFEDDRIVAWAGGEFRILAGGRTVPSGRAALVRADEELSISGPLWGCRAWLAISGGIDVAMLLGSRSTDLRGKFGGLDGRRLRDSDVLSLQKQTSSWPDVENDNLVASWGATNDWSSPAQLGRPLHFVRGSDWARFSPAAQRALSTDVFTVAEDSDRMGIRLEGPELARTDSADLISEPVVAGTVQVPPSGWPIVLLGDCQTIGGYPKIAHVITVDLPMAAQLRPGDRMRFREITLVEAHRLLQQRERDFQYFKTGLSLRKP